MVFLYPLLNNGVNTMTVIRKNLRIKMINSSEPSSHIFRSLVDAFSTIGNKSYSKDRNAARHVLSQLIVNKSTRALQLLKPTSKLVGLDIKTIHRYCSRREQLDSVQKKCLVLHWQVSMLQYEAH